MIRVLQVIGDLGFTGIPVVIMNYYRNMDRSKVQFDFIATNPGGRFEEEIRQLGGNIYYLPPKFRHPFKYMKGLKKIIKANNYDIVHSNTNSASAFLDLYPAKRAKCKVRIAHSHNNGCNIKWQHYIFKPLLPMVANVRYACSKEAGKWMFGNKKFELINNGIDFEKYKFNQQKRTEIRQENNWQDNYIIGHIGSFQERKNQRFLVEMMHDLLKQIPNAKLVLIGDGETRQAIEELANNLGVKNNIEFLGNRLDTVELIQGFDVFCLPSFAEGMAMVLIEAQVAGLACFVSKAVPYVTLDNTNPVTQIELNKANWIQEICEYKAKNIQRHPLSQELMDTSDYNIKNLTNILLEKYIDLKNQSNQNSKSTI